MGDTTTGRLHPNFHRGSTTRCPLSVILLLATMYSFKSTTDRVQSCPVGAINTILNVLSIPITLQGLAASVIDGVIAAIVLCSALPKVLLISERDMQIVD